MSGIVCAIRGGPTSQPTIERAIALAKETQLPLHFLYVVNLDFLTYSESSRVRHLSEEMHEMGELIVLSAQEKAAAKGVEAHGEVRHGSVGEEIINLCRDLQAEYAVLGRPGGEREEDVFTRERLQRFMGVIRQESGAEVVLPEEGPAT